MSGGKEGQLCLNRKTLQAEAVIEIATQKSESLHLLEEMSQVLGQHFGVSLPLPDSISSGDDLDVKIGKEFSVGLLENPVCHDWYGPIQRLSLRDRVTVSGSLFLWRKTLPSSSADMVAHRERVTAPCLDPPPGYILHLCKLVDEMFPVGWDKGYCAAIESAVPTINSVLERGKNKGGYRSLGPDRLDYGRACMGEFSFLDGDDSCKVRYMDAVCDGKTRAVTVMSSDAQALKPLHKLLYDQISSFPWLLRGKAKPNRFRSFSKVPGEVFVSGDYESATDHLPVTTAEWILKRAFKNARHIPETVMLSALRYLRVTIVYPDGVEVSATRQLMGSLLCFPLLCIQNYIAFRWVFGPSTPVKVNGDDIVFRSTREDYEKWASFVGSVGLRLSPGKTLVSTSFFSLNSTFFHVTKSAVRLIPVVRCSTLMKAKSPYPNALAGSMQGFLEGFRGDLRDKLGAWFLRIRAKLIRKSGRSVLRGLGIRASERMIKESGLWRRELWYVNSVPSRFDKGLGQPVEGVELPNPPDRLVGQVKLPEGWRRIAVSRKPSVRAYQRSAEREFWEEVTESAWGTPFVPRDAKAEYWRELETGSYEGKYHDWLDLDSRKVKPFIRLFIQRISKVNGLRSRLKSAALYALISRPLREKKETVWVRVGEEETVDDPASLFRELVQRKIELVDSWEASARSMHYEKWCDQEAALDLFVQ